MSRGLDHAVHAVRDLDAAAELYRRLGFTVGARNRHPWGTHNHIVQLPGSFIELLAVVEPDKLGSDGFSILFGVFNRDFLARAEGLSLLILESKDAAADEAGFRNAGIAQSTTMHFEREAKRPDGSTVKVGFSLAFAKDADAPWIHFATCQQHFPENFWNPAFQRHANGAQALAAVVMVAAKPVEHRAFLSSFTGSANLKIGGNVVTAKAPHGDITIMDPVGFHGSFGSAAPPVADGARLAALRFTVTDVPATEGLLRKNNIAFVNNGSQLVVGASTAMGATIAFEQAR